VTAVEDYFAQYGSRAPRLARLYGDTVEFLVSAHGIEVLDRLELDLPCACCDEEKARAARLTWMTPYSSTDGGSQDWRKEPSTNGFRLQRGALFLTYPASASGSVFLAAQGTATTQSFLENNEGIK
jgi:hypothetical protein